MSIVLLGSTSGSVTLHEPAVAGTTVLDLPATSGTVLVGGTQNIPTASLPIGSVLQVVNVAYAGGTTSSSSSTYADVTGLTATITPNFSTSKILVIVSVNGCKKTTNNTYLALRLVRDATVIHSLEQEGGYTNNSDINEFGGCGCNFLDSPATTSATTYKIQLASVANNAEVSVGNSNSGSTITLMEIAA